MSDAFLREEMLLGAAAMQRLAQAHVIVFGIGGVGSYVAEGLARAGVGALTLVDNDTVGQTNLNRQLCALHSTIGQYKSDVMARRILDINPDCRVTAYPIFYTRETAEDFDFSGLSYIVDAIDTVSAKLALIERAKETGVPIISCMGTGNKLDASAFQVADISKTAVCPLARVMRRELGKRGIRHLKVVYSREEAWKPSGWEEEAAALGKRQIPGSVSFVPGAAGLLLAGEVIRDLTGYSRM